MNDDFYLDRPVLAIYPNTNGFGYALFDDESSPNQCGMVSVKIRHVTKYLERLDRMIKVYEPSILVLPTPDGKFNKKRERIQSLLSSIHDFATEKGIVVKIYSREQIRIAFGQSADYTKQRISELICETFPRFNSICPKEKKWYEPESYMQGMFDAISLAVTHYYMT